MYDISKESDDDEFVPWYGEARLMVTPLADTQIKVRAGADEFVICADETGGVTVQRDAAACSAMPGESEMRITVAKPRTSLKVSVGCVKGVNL